MTSVERTAYPQFPKLMTARELHVFCTPSVDEAVWARERTDTDDHLLALTLALKPFQRMGRFPKRDEVPEVVVDHVRRYLADPALRRRVTAATNKVEAYNGFSAWLRFGNGGVIADNDPAEQEKIINFNSLLANCVIFHTALDMTEVIRQLIAEGWEITADLLAQLSPYLTEHINRFGVYPTDDLHIKPQAFDPELAEIDFGSLPNAA